MIIKISGIPAELVAFKQMQNNEFILLNSYGVSEAEKQENIKNYKQNLKDYALTKFCNNILQTVTEEVTIDEYYNIFVEAIGEFHLKEKHRQALEKIKNFEVQNFKDKEFRIFQMALVLFSSTKIYEDAKKNMKE